MNRKELVARASTWIYQKAADRPVVALFIVGALLYLLFIFGPALLFGIRQNFSDRAVEKGKSQAEAERTAGQQEKIQADEIEIQRKAEDLNRATNLTPERERAAGQVQTAQQRRQEAEDRYEKNRTARRPDLDDPALRRRNCADLAELYPAERFAGCQ